jgi:hypothetical protein
MACPISMNSPVPHRHFTFTIPKMLRPYFRFHRGLIKDLCRIAHRCLAEFQRTTLGLPEGTTGVVMAVHTFVDGRDPEPTALDYPGIDDGIRGMAFIEATVESSNHNARWTPLKI